MTFFTTGITTLIGDNRTIAFSKVKDGALMDDVRFPRGDDEEAQHLAAEAPEPSQRAATVFTPRTAVGVASLAIGVAVLAATAYGYSVVDFDAPEKYVDQKTIHDFTVAGTAVLAIDFLAAAKAAVDHFFPGFFNTAEKVSVTPTASV